LHFCFWHFYFLTSAGFVSSREWFFLLSHELFSPKRGLFEFSDEQTYLLQIASGGKASQPISSGAAPSPHGNGMWILCLAGTR
jgi:hypothetical protein